MPGLEELTGKQLLGLFEQFTDVAFRVECQPVYAMSYERETFERFLAGDPPPDPSGLEWLRPWLERVRGLTTAGRRIKRVRILDEPPTDYQRFNVWIGQWNTGSGEDIRYLTRHHAAVLGIPADLDWWLFDNAALVIMRYDGYGQLVSRELDRDAGVVAQHQRLSAVALQHGVAPGDLSACWA